MPDDLLTLRGTREALRDLEAQVAYIRSQRRNDRPQARGADWLTGAAMVQRIVGVLDGNLSAPGSAFNSTTATLSVWKKNVSTGWADSTTNVTITNRNPNLEATAGDVILCERVADEWWPLAIPPLTITKSIRTVTAGTTVNTGDADGLILFDTDTAGSGLTCSLGFNFYVGEQVILKNIGTSGYNVTTTGNEVYDQVGTAYNATIGDGGEAHFRFAAGSAMSPTIWWRVH